MQTQPTSGSVSIPPGLLAMLTEVAERIPPLWDLHNYVAVNPFLGFVATPMADATRDIQAGLGANVLPNLDYYRKQWQAGRFSATSLERAAQQTPYDSGWLAKLLNGAVEPSGQSFTPLHTAAEQHDHTYGTEWNALVVRHVTRWCAVHVGQGGAGWYLPSDGAGLYASWRAAAAVDHSMEIAGLADWRTWVASLPARAEAAIATCLAMLELAPEHHAQYLYRLLAGVFGWASYLRRASWAAGTAPVDLIDLLAIRASSDVAVAMLAPQPAQRRPGTPPAIAEDQLLRYTFQEAVEDHYLHELLTGLQPISHGSDSPAPIVQAIFCIDVRSEPLRRHLEVQHAQIETRGFAGFFGVFLELDTQGQTSARCPVLLKPALRVRTGLNNQPDMLNPTLKHVQYAPASAFSYVETLGLLYGARLIGDALTLTRSWHPTEANDVFTLAPDQDGTGLTSAARLDLAILFLKNTGLRKVFGRLVLLVGHEGRSANNPHQAGLDCGACGGHGGAINARIAAAVLNDPTVRQALPAHGWTIPADTWFVAGLHDTSVDRVQLLDTKQIPASHTGDLQQLQHWLDQAGRGVRAERSAALGLTPKPAGLLERLLNRRARDWSEVRPEWALARNAAFIVARRERTRAVDLQGRAFLHEYDWTTDPDRSILTLILTAPMVVASWINLQYFASTVDNAIFGAGTKTLHNRVEGHGVVLGNGGDLRTGLALQSVQAADGQWFHEPLRLQIIVEAPQEWIDTILAAHPQVRMLVEHGWVRLFALDPHSLNVERRMANGLWAALQTDSSNLVGSTDALP